MKRPNPSCTNPICGPVLREIESCVGCWAAGACGYTAVQLSEIMRVKDSIWKPKVQRPQITTGSFDLEPRGAYAGYSKHEALEFWRWLLREGWIPYRYEWES